MTDNQKTASCVLFPVFLLSCVFTLFLAVQTAFVVNDHKTLVQVQAQQDKPLAQLEKIKAQLNALGTGTLVLAKAGNKDAQDIIQKLKKAGVEVRPHTDKSQQGTEAPAPTQTPAATE